MSEPTLTELLERINKIEAVTRDLAKQIEGQQKDTRHVRELISIMLGRFKKFENQHRQHKDLDGAIVEHNERLHSLEAKLFPNMWPTIDRVESLVGDLYDRYDIHHPLDRKKKPGPTA